MSEKERAIQLLDHIPDWKMSYVLGFLEGVAIPDEIPNDETLRAFDEIKNGNGIHFTGSTDERRTKTCSTSHIPQNSKKTSKPV